MQSTNPYDVTSQVQPAVYGDGPRRVAINPIDAISRGYRLLGDQYWLFLAVTFVGMIISSLVPMGILTGPIFVGFFICLMHRERGVPFEFGTMFKGFDQFLDSLVAVIIMVVASFILILPAVIGMMVIMGALAANTANNGQPGPMFPISILAFGLIIGALSFLLYVPFLFCFQLIADRKLSGVDAVKLSAKAAWVNIGGILLLMIVGGLISMVLAMMCYLPLFFFMPIWIAAMWVVYRDVFPETIIEAQTM